MATVLLSYVEFEPSVESLAIEVLWFTAAAVVFWVVGSSKWADRNVTRFLHWLLRGRTRLPAERIENLLLFPNGYQVAAITVGDGNKTINELLSTLPASPQRPIALGVLHSDGTYVNAPFEKLRAQPTDQMLLYGITRDLEALRATVMR